MSKQKTYRDFPLRTATWMIIISEVILLALLAVFWYYLLPSIDELVVERPKWGLYLLATSLLVPLFILTLYRRRKALQNFMQDGFGKSMAGGFSPGRQALHFILWRWAIACLLFAIINPRFGKSEIEVKQQGIDIMLCLDVSRSMLAADMSPNRLVRARRAISQLFKGLNGDRVGLIVFAGDAYVQLPITTDYGAAEMFLTGVNTDMVSTQGTAIGSAIELAVKSFSETSVASRSIIIITDGENHEDDAIDAASKAAELGISVHTIGMGSEAGAPLPIIERGRTLGYKEDKEGNTVISKLDEATLREISTAGNGVFVRANDGDAGLDAILEEIDKMQQTEFGTEQFADYEDRFQIFILLAAFLIIIETVLPHSRTKWLSRMNIFE